MKRKLQEFIEKAEKSSDYNYQVESIEKYLDDVEARIYETAKTFVDKVWEKISKFPKVTYRDFESEEHALKKEIAEREERIEKFDDDVYQNKYKSAIKNLWAEMRESKPELKDEPIVSLEDFDVGYQRRMKKLYKDYDKEVREFRNLPENNCKELRARLKVLKEEKNKYRRLNSIWNNFERENGDMATLLNLRECKTIEDAYECAKKYSTLNRRVFRYDIYHRTVCYVGKLSDMEVKCIHGGSLNGVVIGETGRKARVETILAGGYNIQCLHYRVLVYPIDD